MIDMTDFSRRQFLGRTVASGVAACVGTAWRTGRADAGDVYQQAAASARIAGYSISKVQRWLHEKALPLIDTQTGLYRADGHWNYQDTAADCYPFLCWAAHLVDRDALYGPVLAVLESEQRLCNHLDRIPVAFDWDKRTRNGSLEHDLMVFGASEYVKDGLVAVVEAVGKGPWSERMQGIMDDLWRNARVDTPFGKISSTNVEVNGDQLQALTRLFTMTGDDRYLQWARRLADYCLADPKYVPQRLRDHGCEIIGGLGLLAGVESQIGSSRAEPLLTRLREMFDQVLARGTNPDGMMFNGLGEPNSGLSDGWGYNYVGLLCYDMAAGQPRYRDRVARTLGNLSKTQYANYPWEGKSIDGFADSIEGAIYLLNRVPVPEGFAWVDREMAANVVRTQQPLATAELWGTMKLESNGVRTTVMHALMHTQGLIARPWRPDLTLGAARTPAGGLAVVMSAGQPWRGCLEFDIPRHRAFMGFRHDWPRMNTLPEWFTVQPERTYRVEMPGLAEQHCRGAQLQNGLPLQVEPGIRQLMVNAVPS